MTIGSMPLVLDLIEWLVIRPRPYAEVMEAWRTTCARLPIWEEAVDRGFIVSEMVSPGCVLVTVTPAGRASCDAKVAAVVKRSPAPHRRRAGCPSCSRTASTSASHKPMGRG